MIFSELRHPLFPDHASHESIREAYHGTSL
jgi:hypothetical protein